MTFQLEQFNSPVGGVLLVSTADGVVRAVDFSGFEERMHRLLARHWGAGVALESASAPSDARRSLEKYFEGDVHAVDTLRVETRGTEFQRSVWKALRSIPCGETWTYGQLAGMIGNPRAIRAVGLANSQNPVAIIVPCHRVVGANHSLTGYAGGLDRKRWLLHHEGAPV